MNDVAGKRANQDMQATWERLWKLEGGEATFSIHREILERAKWRYLTQDLSGKPAGLAMEVGCGSGTLGTMLAMSGYQVILLDYAGAALQLAQESFKQIPGRERKLFVQGNAFSLPFGDGSIDVIVSGGLLEHFEKPDMIVQEMSRVLKPGGLFYADIWPKRFSILRLIERLHRQAEGWFEIRMSKREAFEMIQQCGLIPLRVFTAGVMPPRDMPLTNRFKAMNRFQRFVLGKLEWLWVRLDGTLLADWIGAYYYVSAIKPAGRADSGDSRAAVESGNNRPEKTTCGT